MKRSLVVYLTVLSIGVVGLTTPSRAEPSRSDAVFLVGQSGSVEAGQDVEAAIVIGGSLNVAGRVRGPAVAVGGSVDVMPGAVVEQGVYAIGGALSIGALAQVQGARMQVAPGNFSDVASQLSASKERKAGARWVGPSMRLGQVLAVFLIGSLLVFAAPRQVQGVRRTLEQHPRKAALAGLALMLGFIPGCILLAVTLLGIPLIPLAVLVLVASFVMGLTALAALIGFRLPAIKGSDKLFGAMAFGMLFVALAAVIPVFGSIVMFFGSFYAAGGVLVSRFGTRTPSPPPTAASTSEAAPSHPELRESPQH